MSDDIRQRKDDHLELCLQDRVRAPRAHSLDRVLLEYDSVPELDLDEVDVSAELFGKRVKAPILIGAMTGGSEAGGVINRNLALAAQKLGIGMCLGSQRAMLEHPEVTGTYDVRAVAPELPLLVGNLGAIQLNKGVGVEEIRALLGRLPLDVLAFHLNPLQEAIQPAGDTNYRGVLNRMAEVIPQLGLPCIVKEVGAGISRRAATKLAALPVAGIDVAGVGGTSWAMVEALRASDGAAAAAGRRLAWFGVETARSIRYGRELFPDRAVIGSGGISTGYHVAAAIALGADAVAIAQPLLAAAREGADKVVAVIEEIIYELRVVMFCTGAATLSALRDVRRVRVSALEPEA